MENNGQSCGPETVSKSEMSFIILREREHMRSHFSKYNL